MVNAHYTVTTEYGLEFHLSGTYESESSTWDNPGYETLDLEVIEFKGNDVTDKIKPSLWEELNEAFIQGAKIEE